MDDTLQNLENELKRLPARKPSARFMESLQRELGPIDNAVAAVLPARTPDRFHWRRTSWALLAAAAAIAIVAVVQLNQKAVPVAIASEAIQASNQTAVAPAESVSRYEPVQASSVLYDLHEEGVTTLPDQSEGRQLRYRYVDTYTWKNSATNASLRWSVPRDEVRLVRANLD
jgi:hypothetical protein